MHLQFRNVNHAFRAIVRAVYDGVFPVSIEGSRNGDVLRLDEPLLLTYDRPRERVLFNAARDANPFFHLYEALWMLAGRNDLAPVAYYARQMAEYSDDGVTLNGSYGERWRSRFGFDQLAAIERHLSHNLTSRRAVLQMWAPEHDLSKVEDSKDVCCLAGDTVFRSPEGETTIKELARRFQLSPEYRHPVYTVDPTTGLQGFGWMTNAWKVGVKKVLRVGLDDGSFIRLTTDHVIYRKTSLGRPAPGRKSRGFRVDECQAGDVSVGDRLLAELPADAKCRRDRDGRRMFKLSLAHDTRKTNMATEHREYWKFAVNPDLRDDYDVHHRNEDKADNRLSNLEEVSHGEHQRRHKIADPSWGKYTPNRSTDGKFNRVDNHKVISIEDGGFCEVYDFTVPGRHNAVLSNGVVVHNCNLSVIVQGREQNVGPNTPNRGDGAPLRYLDLYVTNRSNDLIWGLLGANAVHFSFLQEYLAARLGWEVGRMHTFTANAHAYTWNWKPEEWLGYYGSADEVEYVNECCMVPLVEDPARFEEELPRFVEDYGRTAWREGTDACAVPPGRYKEPFLADVAGPALAAFRAHKLERRFPGHPNGYAAFCSVCLANIEADDWRTACTEWIERRRAKHERQR